MKANYLSASIKKIKKAHKRTKVVSTIYAIGLLLLTVLAFFPTINIQFAGKGKLSLLTFFWPIVNIFKKNINIVDLIVMVLYLAMLTLVVICFFRGMTRFGKILRRTSGNVTTCNKNLAIMEEIADIFSGALASYVIFNFVIYMITYAVKPAPQLFGAVTLWAVVALALSLIVHFIGGIAGSKVSVFIIGATIEEKKREDKIFPFFIRNLIQTISVAGILYFFVPATNLYIELGYLFEKGQTSALTNIGGDLFAFLALVLQVAVIATTIVLIKHTTANTEYNRIGMDAIGMRNFRVFGLITLALCVGLFIVDTTDGTQMNYLYAAIVALIATVLDFIIKPKVAKPVEDDPMLRKYQNKVYEALENPQPEQQQQQAPNCCMYRPCYNAANTPVAEAVERNADENAQNGQQGNVTNVNNSYYNAAGAVLPTSNNEGGLPDGLPEGLPQDAPTILDVKCPSCEKMLSVRESAPYHRCPACGKVFQIRKGRKVGGQFIEDEPQQETDDELSNETDDLQDEE